MFLIAFLNFDAIPLGLKYAHSRSERADTDMYRLSADISVIGRYIGFADKANAYRYRLSVSADMIPHIGS